MKLTYKSTSAQVRQDFENCFEHAEEGDIGITEIIFITRTNNWNEKKAPQNSSATPQFFQQNFEQD